MKFSQMENCFFYTERRHDFSRKKKAVMGFLNCSLFFQFDRPLAKASHGFRHAVLFLYFAYYLVSVSWSRKTIEIFSVGGGIFKKS